MQQITHDNNKAVLIDITAIRNGKYEAYSPYQKELYHTTGQFKKLFQSIEEKGLINPIHLTRLLEMMDGEMRKEVYKKMGKTHIWAYLHDILDCDIPLFMVNANLTRTKTKIEMYDEGLMVYNNLPDEQGKRNDLYKEPFEVKTKGKKIEIPKPQTKYEKAASILNNEIIKASGLRMYKEIIDFHKKNPIHKIPDQLNKGVPISRLHKLCKQIVDRKDEQQDARNNELLPNVPANFYSNECYDIYLGDSANIHELPKEFRARRFQLTVTSNPYKDQRFYGSAEGGHGNEMTVEEAIENMRVVFTNVFEMTLDTGVCCINTNDTYQDGEYLDIPEKIVAMMRQIGWKKIEVFIWRKTSTTLKGDPNTKATDCWEYLYVFAKDKIKYLEKYNHLKIPSDKNIGFSISGGRRNADATKTTQRLCVNTPYKPFLNFIDKHDFDKNVIQTANASSYSRYLKVKYGAEHEAVMEPTLPILPILLYSSIGDTLYDPYLGSGTSIRAAILMGRRGLGVEIEQANFDLCKRHLDHIRTQMINPKLAELIELGYSEKKSAA